MMTRILLRVCHHMSERGRGITSHVGLKSSRLQIYNNYDYHVHAKLCRWPVSLTMKYYSSNEINNPERETALKNLYSESDPFAVLEKVEDIEKIPQILQSEYIASLCSHLQNTYYLHCSLEGECKSWLMSNARIAFAQLSMNECVDRVMQPVTSSEFFCNLLSSIDEQLPFMDVKCKTIIGQSLVFLGTDTCNPVLQKLYLTLRHDITHADIGTLELFSQMLRGFPMDPIAIYNINQRLKTIMIDSSISYNNVLDLCNLVTKMAQFMTHDFHEIVLKKVNATVTAAGMQTDNKLLCGVIRFVKFIAKYERAYIARNKGIKVEFQSQSQNTDVAELYSKIIYGGIGCEKFDTSTISLLSRLPGIQNDMFPLVSLKDVQKLKSKLVFEARKLIIQNGENIQLKNVISLLHAVRHANDDDITRFQNVFNAKLDGGDIDIFLLSRMASFLESVKPSLLDPDMWQFFEVNVGNHAENIVRNRSRYVKMMWLLMKKQIKNIEAKDTLRQASISQLTDGRESFSTSRFLFIPFLLSSQDEALPKHIYQKLLSSIPNLSVYNIAFLANLPEIRNHTSLKQQYYRNQKLHDQINVVRKEIICSTLDRVDNINDITAISKLADVFVSKSNNRDPSLTNKLLNKVGQLKENINEVNLKLLIKAFLAVSYHNAETYDHICNFLIENKQLLQMKSHNQFLIACNAVGYHPRRLNELSDIVIDMIHHHKEKGQWFKAIELVSNLVGLQVFPEALLADVFTIESLENLDTFVREKPLAKKTMEHMMIQLNRTVILECPQLDVPWLFADYNFRMEEPRQDLVNHYFFHEVEKALMEILGGEEYLKCNTYSLYGHHIAFECSLNELGLPIAVTEDKFDADTAQRIAVMIWGHTKFCHSSDRLKGVYQTCNRQLQILGYNLVQVPIGDWTSMGLADWPEKISYLEQKIDTLKGPASS